MSKSSKLRTALKAFNVSECVRDFNGNIMPSCLVSECSDYWAKLGVTTVDEFQEYINLYRGYSDYYKSVHEIRPSRDPESPVHKDNRVETCKNCHTLADENYAAIDAHPGIQLDAHIDEGLCEINAGDMAALGTCHIACRAAQATADIEDLILC